jgi:hypothetical protein
VPLGLQMMEWVRSPTGKLAGCGLGIFVCYFYYGVLQERMWVPRLGALLVSSASRTMGQCQYMAARNLMA